MVAPRTPREVADWASAAQRELAALLATRERSAHRVLTLNESFAKLTALSLKQDALMREALYCVEQGLYRPAHVSAWAAFIDYCHEWLTDSKRIALMRAARAKWTINVAADLRQQTDFAVFEAMHAAGLISKTVMKALQGLLNKRNECAHPEEYDPSLNDTLGYVDELMKRIAALHSA
jgi:hypothetical protein